MTAYNNAESIAAHMDKIYQNRKTIARLQKQNAR